MKYNLIGKTLYAMLVIMVSMVIASYLGYESLAKFLFFSFMISTLVLCGIVVFYPEK